jgi:heme/copper-type cytochrome/quinol oxidase subunit 2
MSPIPAVQGSNLLIVVTVPISLIVAILLAVVVFQAVYYNRRRVHLDQMTEIPLPAISISPILTAQAQEFNTNDPYNLGGSTGCIRESDA